MQAGASLQPTDLNPRSLVMQRYALGVKDAMALALKRQWIFFLRNKAFIIFRLMQVSGVQQMTNEVSGGCCILLLQGNDMCLTP